MAEENTRTKVLRDFLVATPHDADRKWAEYVALAPDLAGFLDPKRGQAMESSSSASAPTHSTASLHVLRSAAPANESSLKRGSTKDDLSLGARRMYDYLICATNDLHEPASTTSSPTSAPAASEVSTVLREATALNVTPIAVEINATDLPTMVPTSCSSECPSHDTAVPLSVLISSATPISSTTSGNDFSKVAAPVVSNPAAMSLTSWSSPLEQLPGPLCVRLVVPEQFTWSPTTGSTDCSGRSVATPPSLLAQAYNVFKDESIVTGFVPWPPPSCTYSRPTLIHGRGLLHAHQKHGKESLVLKESQGECNTVWLAVREDTQPFQRVKVVKLKPPWPSFVCSQVWIQSWSATISEELSVLMSKLKGITSGVDTKSGDVQMWPDLYAMDGYHIVKPTVRCMIIVEQDLQSDCKTLPRCCSNIPDDALMDRVSVTLLESILQLVLSRITFGEAVYLQFSGPLHDAHVYWSFYYLQVYRSDLDLALVIVNSSLQTLGSYCVTSDQYHWNPKRIQLTILWFHRLLDIGFQFCPAGKASLYDYSAAQIQWEIAWPTNTLSYSVPSCMHMYLILEYSIPCRMDLYITMESSILICYLEIEIKILAIHSIFVLHLHWDPGALSRLHLVLDGDNSLCHADHFIQKDSELMQWTFPWFFSCPVLGKRLSAFAAGSDVPTFMCLQFVIKCNLGFHTELPSNSKIELKPWPSWELFSCIAAVSRYLASLVLTLKIIYCKSNHYRQVQILIAIFIMFSTSANLHVRELYWLVGLYCICDCFVAQGNWLRIQPVGGHWKIHAALLLSCTISRTIDSEPTIEQISGMFRLAPHCLEVRKYFAMDTQVILSWDPEGSSPFIPATTESTLNGTQLQFLYMTWDPGGHTQHRLEGKPIFKEGGLSASFPVVHSWARQWAATIGLGLPDYVKGNNYKYQDKGHRQLGLDRTDWTAASAEAWLGWRVLRVCSLCFFFLFKSSSSPPNSQELQVVI